MNVTACCFLHVYIYVHVYTILYRIWWFVSLYMYMFTLFYVEIVQLLLFFLTEKFWNIIQTIRGIFWASVSTNIKYWLVIILLPVQLIFLLLKIAGGIPIDFWYIHRNFKYKNGGGVHALSFPIHFSIVRENFY